MRRNVEEEAEEDEEQYECDDEHDEGLQRVLGVVCVRSVKNECRCLFMLCHNG